MDFKIKKRSKWRKNWRTVEVEIEKKEAGVAGICGEVEPDILLFLCIVALSYTSTSTSTSMLHIPFSEFFFIYSH